MGVRLLGDTLRRRRGEAGLSQKAAARAWGFPYSTLCAIEKGEPRNYLITNIARLDPILGLDAWTLLHEEEPEPTGVVVNELRAELDDLRAVVTGLQARLAEGEPSRLTPLETVAGDLTNGELDDLVAFAHFLRSRRRRVNGS